MKPPFALTLAAFALLAASVHAEEKIPLVLQLPRPLLVGTPVPVKLPNMEAPRTGPRPAFLVPAGTTNLALKKPVTASDSEPLLGDLSLLTDGDKNGEEGSYAEFGPGKQWVQIDLGAAHPLHVIAIWHFHSQARAYKDVVVQICDDAAFKKGVTTVWNSDLDNRHGFGAGKDPIYIDTYEGRLIDAKAATGRYVRLYSNGSTSSDLNHYIEVEIYGTP
jgi:hypothetical protein